MITPTLFDPRERVIRRDAAEGVIVKRLTFGRRGFISFEEGPNTLWILDIYTAPKSRNCGLAKALIARLKEKNKRIEPGVFTEDGQKYLARYFKKF